MKPKPAPKTSTPRWRRQAGAVVEAKRIYGIDMREGTEGELPTFPSPEGWKAAHPSYLATGTGKTFIAFQIAWKLFHSRWNALRRSVSADVF